MKLVFTYDQIVDRLKAVDKRVETMSEAQINLLMDRGYSILVSQYGYAFTNEDVVELDEYYASDELKLTFDVEDDVVDVYDLYLTEEGLSRDLYPQGIRQEKSEKFIYRDNRYVGRVHADLNGSENSDGTGQFDNAVVKYCFTPTHSTESIMVASITMTALEFAFSAAIYSYVKDHDSKDMALADMMAVGSSIPMPPEDEVEQVRSIF